MDAVPLDDLIPFIEQRQPHSLDVLHWLAENRDSRVVGVLMAFGPETTVGAIMAATAAMCLLSEDPSVMPSTVLHHVARNMDAEWVELRKSMTRFLVDPREGL